MADAGADAPACVSDQTRQSHSEAEDAAGVHQAGAAVAEMSEVRSGIAVLTLPCGCGRADVSCVEAARRTDVRSVLLDGAIVYV